MFISFPLSQMFVERESTKSVPPLEQASMRNVYSMQTVEDERMDWNRVEGNWKQVKGKVKEKWGQLTEDDLNVINGRRDQLEGKIQERYGLAKDQVRQDVDNWYAAQRW